MIKIKLIIQKIEIFEEMLIVNECDAYYYCLYSFIVDFHHWKVKLTKEWMQAIQCEAYNWCFFLKIKLIRKKIETFEEMLIENNVMHLIVVYIVL